MLLPGMKKQQMDESNLHDRIQKILSMHRVVTIGCKDNLGVWTAPVFYAADGFDLIWVSSPNSRHSKAIEADNHVAASIYDGKSQWQKIQGLQLEGQVETSIDGKSQQELQRLYVRKFPFTGQFFSQQKTLPEPIKAKVNDVVFYRLRTSRIVLIDNTVSFGFHYELKM